MTGDRLCTELSCGVEDHVVPSIANDHWTIDRALEPGPGQDNEMFRTPSLLAKSRFSAEKSEEFKSLLTKTDGGEKQAHERPWSIAYL